MRILLYGAGRMGARVLRQFEKNPAIEVVVVDPRGKEAYAVEEEIIDRVDIEDTLTPMNLDEIVERLRPDLILLATASEDLGLGNPPGLEVLAGSLEDEITAVSPVPVVSVARNTAPIRRADAGSEGARKKSKKG